MDLGEAIRPHPQGCTIRFEVAPGSSCLAVPSGFNPWRRALGARLTEQPSRGRANLQLMGEVAKALGIPKDDIEVMSGHKSALKVLLARGVDARQAISLLGPRIDEKG
ncbi:MAG: hypothetical protein A4E48_00541 [Methanosaeta sp. PtaU1.Bin060]|nr:MAG: hypothetical protein A4E48_00541 [Methanosaeta sp. PtaU1.Bin060]